jgi:peptidoglycan/xylan/chitin deacetylase (PgdA/CDA1 family)
MTAQYAANIRPIPILVYHQIAEAPAKGSPFRSLYVSPASFARQMAWLKRLGYAGMSMGGLRPYLNGQKTGKVVGITFDDGYQNNLIHALPTLVKCGFTSTCYAVSERLGATNSWDASIGIAQTPLMSGEELKQWIAGGQEIGSHTMTHANLLEADDAAAWLEVEQGRQMLRDVTGHAIDDFCYPYGLYRPSHVELARHAGFATATTTRRGRCHAGDGLLELPRVPVMRSTTLPIFWLKVATGYEDRPR